MATGVETKSRPAAVLAIDPDYLRQLTVDCIAKQMHSAACFYADKLVTLTQGAFCHATTCLAPLTLVRATVLPGNLNDVYLLARTYLLSKQYTRAVNLLAQRELLGFDNPQLQRGDLRFLHLAALCHVSLTILAASAAGSADLPCCCCSVAV
jgi:hypothetical protein